MRWLGFMLWLAATSARADIIGDVRAAIGKNDFARAEALLRSDRTSRGVTLEGIEALSWIGRGALAQKNLSLAEKSAREAYDLAREQLKRRRLEAEPHLQAALGASIEVQGNAMAARGERAEAVTYLQDQLKLYARSPIHMRIQKSINLLTLEGKPLPPLEGVTLPKGRPVIVFLWAHWCPDCKQEAPILARLKSEFAAQGLTIIAPTQRYGYIEAGTDAPPDLELRYIEQIRDRYYHDVVEGRLIVSEANFRNMGVSSTPTLLLVDRAGIVRSYHPGAMSYDELRRVVERLVKPTW